MLLALEVPVRTFSEVLCFVFVLILCTLHTTPQHIFLLFLGLGHLVDIPF